VFGLTDILGWQNIRQERLNFDVAPRKNLTVSLQQEFLRAASREDNVYTGSAGVLVKPPTSGFASSGVGHEFDASARQVFRGKFVINAGVGHFSPDTLMVNNNHGSPVTLAYLGLTYRLSIAHEPTPCGFKHHCRAPGN
jgi:hypothetical protein